jgi:hypothetical protein
VGVAVTELPVVPDKPPPAGAVQVYVLAPVTDNVLLLVAQIVAGLGVTVRVGLGFTVNVTVCATLVQDPTEPVTVYTNAVATAVVFVAVTFGVAVVLPLVILPPAGTAQT